MDLKYEGKTFWFKFSYVEGSTKFHIADAQYGAKIYPNRDDLITLRDTINTVLAEDWPLAYEDEE